VAVSPPIPSTDDYETNILEANMMFVFTSGDKTPNPTGAFTVNTRGIFVPTSQTIRLSKQQVQLVLRQLACYKISDGGRIVLIMTDQF